VQPVTSTSKGDDVFDLVLEDHSRIPLDGEVTIGRSRSNTVQFDDGLVSRTHAVVTRSPHDGMWLLRDAGSRHGTWVDDRRVGAEHRLNDGERITVGTQSMTFERRRAPDEEGRTVVVPAHHTAAVLAEHVPDVKSATGSRLDLTPRLRSGYALKRLSAAEGPQRWVLKDLIGQKITRFNDADAAILLLLDGRRSLAELVVQAEQDFGPSGPVRLAQLLANLARNGLIADAPGAPDGGTVKRKGFLRPRVKTWTNAGDAVQSAYARGFWPVFTKPLLGIVMGVAVGGLVAFGYLVATDAGTPFVVAQHVGLGGVVFVVGRLAVAAAHEASHAFTLAHYGRRVAAAGVKVVLIFPYVFVDTSDVWFEPRRHRIAVAAAGPACDVFLGGGFALMWFLIPSGAPRDIAFQLAFGAFYGALFNLNPVLDRDGYHIMVDLLRRPGLRSEALEQLRQRLTGRQPETRSRLLDWYAITVLVWMTAVAGAAVVLTLRYVPILAALVPEPVAWLLLGIIWVGLFLPVGFMVFPSLLQRYRRPAQS
jgi:pSer/pThr/pTyr-binding forkhead associated (FHA) protein